MSKIKQPYILIFLKNSIKNQYSGVFKNLRKHKQNMIFHVVAIRELFWKNYSIDLLFFGLSEERVRDILREYKLVALELYEYKESKVTKYWKIKVLINFEWEDTSLLTNEAELESVIYTLTVIWFDIRNINFVDENKLEQSDIDEILASRKWKANQWIKDQENLALKKEQDNEKMFDDQKLKKTQTLVKELLWKIPDFIERAKDTLSKTELKELYEQSQELSKLEMWSNVEKLSSFFETVYWNYTKLEQQLLAIQESPNIDISGSEISDAFLTLEITKLEKAKSLQKLWWAKTWEDMWYANFWWLLLYFKLLKRDIVSKFKNFSISFSDVFWYIVFLLSVISIFCALYISLINNNDFVFVVMVYCGVFGLVLYWIKFIKKIGLMFGIFLSVWAIILSILGIRLLKQFFIF